MVYVKQYPRGSLVDAKGMVLIVALLILAALVLLGTMAVMMSTTDMKISANYKTGNQAFYVAEAGIEEAIARMRENFAPTTGATGRIDDADPTNPAWSVSIGGAGPYTSTQSILSYTVLIVHQKNSANQILYWGDVNGDGVSERTTNPIGATGMANKNIYLATSSGVAANANKRIVVEMTKVPPITAPAALYVEALTTIQGTSTSVIGLDQCGGANMPGIVTTLTADTINKTGNPTVSGLTSSTWSVVGGAANMDIQAVINEQKGSANFSYNVSGATHTGMAWGTPTMGATLQNPSSCSTTNVVYYNTSGADIKLAGGTSGCGLLLVEGDLEINGDFSWYGVVIVTGAVRFLGGGNKNITGAVLAGDSVDADIVGGNANIVYCSTAIRNQTESQPLRRLSWKDQSI